MAWIPFASLLRSFLIFFKSLCFLNMKNNSKSNILHIFKPRFLNISQCSLGLNCVTLGKLGRMYNTKRVEHRFEVQKQLRRIRYSILLVCVYFNCILQMGLVFVISFVSTFFVAVPNTILIFAAFGSVNFPLK